MSKNINVRMNHVEAIIMICISWAYSVGYDYEWVRNWTLDQSLNKALKRVNITHEEYVAYTRHLGYEEDYEWLLDVYDKWDKKQ